jgi:hypothetical protein
MAGERLMRAQSDWSCGLRAVMEDDNASQIEY